VCTTDAQPDAERQRLVNANMNAHNCEQPPKDDPPLPVKSLGAYRRRDPFRFIVQVHSPPFPAISDHFHSVPKPWLGCRLQS
jgi:hypothetical protein